MFFLLTVYVQLLRIFQSVLITGFLAFSYTNINDGPSKNDRYMMMGVWKSCWLNKLVMAGIIVCIDSLICFRGGSVEGGHTDNYGYAPSPPVHSSYPAAVSRQLLCWVMNVTLQMHSLEHQMWTMFSALSCRQWIVVAKILKTSGELVDGHGIVKCECN